MFIVQILGSLADGGAESLVKNYCYLLTQREIKPVVFVLHDEQNTANSRDIHSMGIPIYVAYKKWNLAIRLFNRAFGKLYVSYKLNKVLNMYKPVAIHTHLAVLRYLSPISNSLKNSNLYYTCHSIPERYFTNRNRCEYKACKHLISHNGLELIALHSEMREELERFFPGAVIHVINNGIIFSRFQKVEKQLIDSFKKQYSLNNCQLVIGNVGRFVKSKNHMLAVDVFSEVHRRIPNSKMIFVGDGVDLPIVKDYVEKNGLKDSVLFLSNRSDVNVIMNSFNVFLFPSLYEGLSLTLIEAQCIGLKCVISDTINTANILSEKTITCKLTDEVTVWADTILNPTIINSDYNDISKYNLEMSIDTLINLYKKKKFF